MVSGPVSAAGDSSTSGNVSPGAHVSLTAAGAIAAEIHHASGAAARATRRRGRRRRDRSRGRPSGARHDHRRRGRRDVGRPRRQRQTPAAPSPSRPPPIVSIGAGLHARRQRPHDRRRRARRHRQHHRRPRDDRGDHHARREPGRAGGSVTLRSQSALLVGGAVDTSGAAGGNGQPGGGRRRRSPARPADRSRSAGACVPRAASAATAAASGLPAATARRSSSSCSPSHPPRASSAAAATAAMPACRAACADAAATAARVRVWSQLPSLILLQLVDSGGGTGDPNGADGPQVEESAPTGSRALEDARALVGHAFARRRGLPVFDQPRRRPGQGAADDEGRLRAAAEGRGLRQGRLLGRRLPERRRLAERPLGPISVHGAPVRHAGLHRRTPGDAAARRRSRRS